MEICKPLLEVKNLKTCFSSHSRTIYPVNNVSLEIQSGETLAVVGESGCGKSTLSLSIMRLLQQSGRITDGQILWEGEDLLQYSNRQMKSIRGPEISMIFQDPMSHFHPMLTLGEQLMETVKEGTTADKRKKVSEMLQLVQLSNPARIMKSYSFELSGGMLQRVMIAMALINRPKLLIADEPTTALDVTVQANVLKLLNYLKKKLSMSMLFISHDLGVVAQVADKVAVMYEGRIVEYGRLGEVFHQPRHDYTRHLLEMVPVLGSPLPQMRRGTKYGRSAEDPS